MKPQQKRIHLHSGASLSIQASQYYYCTPRNDTGPYSKVEVGFIEGSPAPEYFRPYADGDFPSRIYGYLPVELVEQFIREQGGICIGKIL